MLLKPLYLWLFLLNLMCAVPWTYGPLTFVCLLTSIVLLAKQITAPEATGHIAQGLLEKLCYVTLGINVLITIGGLVFNPHWIIDIAQNTYAATDAFAHGNNPYTSTAQLWVKEFPANTPHIETVNGQVTMFGIPYYHGYPYFPLMMLSYLPLYALVDGYTSIRLTHILLITANLWAFKLLCERLIADKEIQRMALLIAVTAYLGVLRYAVEAIALGVTDVLISTYLLFCFVALSRQQYLSAGILLGFAQACKLLPAPFVLLGVLLMLWNNPHGDRRDMLVFLSSFVFSCAGLILPFLLWQPEGFVSATILYYLTHHEGGDSTSLWYFLPQMIQPLFLLLGLLLTLASIVVFNKIAARHIVGVMAGSYASYAIFMSFSKMAHLNYLWGVWPLGCFALAYFLAARPLQ